MRIEEGIPQISILELLENSGNFNDDFSTQRIIDRNSKWLAQFSLDNFYKEHPWGFQGFFFLRKFPYEYYVNGNFFPPKIGYAVVDGRKTGFPLRQNRHVHFKSAELIILWTTEKEGLIVEINGENFPIDSNFAICYIPPGIPHNIIFNRPSVTVDLKRLVFGHRKDNLEIGARINEENMPDPLFIICSSCLFEDRVYSLPWLITNKIPDDRVLEENKKKIFLNFPFFSWQRVTFYPKRMLSNPTDFYSFYEIDFLDNLPRNIEEDDKFHLLFPRLSLLPRI